MNTFSQNNNRLYYRDLGKGTPVVFVHGTPSSSEEFLPLMEKLQDEFRGLACDHLGFGYSDKPTSYAYSLKNHGENFSAFIEFLELEAFHLVVHDFGAAIALPYAIQNPHKVLSLTVLNAWAWPFESVESISKIQKSLMTSSLIKFLYLRMNFSAKFLVKVGWGKYRPLTRTQHLKYTEKFKTPQERLGTWAFAKSLLDETDPAWKIESELSVLKKIPILILWGAADKLVTLKSYEHWKKLFPAAQSKILDDVGHFLADEAPELVFKELQEFYHTVNQGISD